MKDWSKEMETVLVNKTANYSEQEKENLQIEYLKNLITKIKTEEVIIEKDLQTKIEGVIMDLPLKTNDEKVVYKSKHINEITNLQTAIAQKFNLVKKKHYLRKYRTMGIAIGLMIGIPIATAFGKIALGPAIGVLCGLTIGLNIGNRRDNRAEFENRVL
jgi:hypothetical protein